MSNLVSKTICPECRSYVKPGNICWRCAQSLFHKIGVSAKTDINAVIRRIRAGEFDNRIREEVSQANKAVLASCFNDFNNEAFWDTEALHNAALENAREKVIAEINALTKIEPETIRVPGIENNNSSPSISISGRIFIDIAGSILETVFCLPFLGVGVTITAALLEKKRAVAV